MSAPTSSGIPTAGSGDVARLLAPYPHVAGCDDCVEYAQAYLREQSGWQLAAAVLDHHDSGHAHDRLSRWTPFF